MKKNRHIMGCGPKIICWKGFFAAASAINLIFSVAVAQEPTLDVKSPHPLTANPQKSLPDLDIPDTKTIVPLVSGSVAKNTNFMAAMGAWPLAESAEDKRNVVKLLEKAAETGYVPAMHNLGVIYETAWLGEQDITSASEWYQKAMAADFGPSFFNLGLMYSLHPSEQGGYTDAVELFKAAMEHGVQEAKRELARMYYFGLGVSQDLARARALYEEAGNAGDRIAAASAAHMYETGMGAEANLDRAGLLYRKAAEQGDGYSQYNVGRIYLAYPKLGHTAKEGVEWLEKAAISGQNVARQDLARLYYRGASDVPADPARALYWTEQLAAGDNDDPEMALAAGVMYKQGMGTDVDLTKAFYWFKKAAAKGSAQAQYKLGELYEKGLGTQKNKEKAIESYRQAAEQNFPEAKLALGLLLYENASAQDVKQMDEAYLWVSKAADDGVAGAQKARDAMRPAQDKKLSTRLSETWKKISPF